ncbi:glycine cleavage system protein GcvH [Microscilla marina]|uniref:Glycine cleavage system H protein n=1 Tax=Microscilla marina ATCC 23134 TaxID=313606 RepID=A1ZE46_MICM2|nr:glycine cleavage system protein GcvH [Microscilla marina]EAY31354.1 glycine cleavage system H protein [Microscilla marina ATCC 23134]
MNFPDNLKYTKEHEWIRLEEDNTAVIGITAHAQSELGDVVYVEIETEGEELEKDAVFGTVEAVKTVADLYLPAEGTVLEVNEKLADTPELVNQDPYGEGWMIKMKFANIADAEELLSVTDYKALVEA